MPYSYPRNIPRPAKNWSASEQKKCVAAANAVLRDGGSEKEAIYACIHAAGRSKKDVDDFEFKETWSTAYVNDLPDSAFLFIEPGCKVKSCRHLPYKDSNGKVDLPHLRNAISRLGQEATGKDWEGFNRESTLKKAQRILESNKEIDEGLVNRVVDKIKQILGIEEEAKTDSGLMLLKNSAGEWVWFARYSSKWLDNDKPQEIISEASHKRFVKMVLNGEAPYPELWLWHIPGTAWGKARWVGYDESGFPLAAGVVYPEYHEVAKALSKRDDILLSHGMPTSSIKYDDADPRVIVEHETREISPLPKWAAANKQTSFVLFKEIDMEDTKNKGISTEDRRKLNDMGISDDIIGMMETDNAKAALVADAMGIESKEASEVEEVEAAEPEVVETEEEVVEDVVEESQEVEEAVAEQEQPVEAMLEDFGKAIQTIVKAVEALNQKVDGSLADLRKEIDEVKGGQDTLSKQIADTPASTWANRLFKSVVGEEATYVDGRTKLAKDGPQEQEQDESEGDVFFWRKSGF